MSLSGLGDAARFQRLRQDGMQLQREMQRLTTELSTGRVGDLGRATGGDFSALADITRGLRLNAAFSDAIANAALQADARQAALDRIGAEIDSFAPAILAFSTGGSLSDLTLSIADAPDRLEQAVGALNTRIAGKSLFAGDAPDRAALIPGRAMLDELRPLIAGAATAQDVVTFVEDWFTAPGGGYETVAWQGGAGDAAPVILGETAREDIGVTARDPALRQVLAGLALAALAAEGNGPADEGERRALVASAAEKMQAGEGGLIQLRAHLGTAQGRIEAARVASETARASLEIEQSRLTSADPYRTATDLEAVQTRLESLYILTARLSRLSLSEYLR